MNEQENRVIGEIIKEAIVPPFEKNLEAILQYGSSQNNKVFWDIDILIILREKIDPEKDIQKLRSVLMQFPTSKLDLQLIYKDEISPANNFSLGASGQFFIELLKEAKVLFGKNPFLMLSTNEDGRIASLLNRIQGYVFKARQENMGMSRYDKDQNPNYHRKHVRRMIFDVVLMFEPCFDEAKALIYFKKLFPDVYTKEQWSLIENSDDKSDRIEEYGQLYEIAYQAALQSRNMLLPSYEGNVLRGELNGLIFEYIIPQTYKKAVVIVDGLPRKPELTSFLKLLASWGVAVFYPRLHGTWESSGTFLDHDPAEDIHALTIAIQRGLPLSHDTVQVDDITVIGASFGGLVSLYTSTFSEVSKVIAFSPVYEMSKVVGVETLGGYLETYFAGAYRFSTGDWKRFISDDLISFNKLTSKPNFRAEKCLIVAGESDEQIKWKELHSIAVQQGIEIRKIPAGHLSFHKHLRFLGPLLHDLLTKE